MDERILKQAEVLVDHSTRVRQNDMVLIRYFDHGLDLAKAVYASVVKRGASALITQLPTEAQKSLYDLSPDGSLSMIPLHEYAAAAASNVVISIRGEENLKALSSVDKKKIGLRSTGTRPMLDMLQSKRWVLTQVPCPSYAQEAEMSMKDYEDFVYSSVNVDYNAEESRLRKIEKLMDETDKVTIKGEDTDLTLSIKGRKAIPGLGEHNVPDGEVFTAPVDNSANGHIYFDFPAIRLGNEVRDVRLTFKDGRITDYKAAKGEDFLKAMVELDEGSHRLGEFATGTNNGITRFTKNILFDEKIGGTIHLAIGNAYEECRGVNKSAIHWDMIKEMKKSGSELIFDGKTVMKDGQFVFES
jgi:aminopeptidase